MSPFDVKRDLLRPTRIKRSQSIWRHLREAWGAWTGVHLRQAIEVDEVIQLVNNAGVLESIDNHDGLSLTVEACVDQGVYVVRSPHLKRVVALPDAQSHLAREKAEDRLGEAR